MVKPFCPPGARMESSFESKRCDSSSYAMGDYSHLQNALILIIVGYFFLFATNIPYPIQHQPGIEGVDSAFLASLEINATGHVYPYTATVVSLSCLMAVIMVIICLGSNV